MWPVEDRTDRVNWPRGRGRDRKCTAPRKETSRTERAGAGGLPVTRACAAFSSASST